MKVRHTALAAITCITLTAIGSMPAFAKSAAEWLTLTHAVQISLTQAVTKAQAVVPGQAIEADLEKGKKGGAPFYEVKLVGSTQNESVVYVNAINGEAVLHKTKGSLDRKKAGLLEQSKVSLTDAVDKAVAHVPGKPLEAQLSNDWGKPSYEVKLLQPDQVVTKVRLDAQTGEVTGTKRD